MTLRIPGFAAALTVALSLTGCTLPVTPSASSASAASTTPAANQGVPIQGRVQGGATPVVGAHVYLFAANTTGYGGASVSLLNDASTGHSDSLGAYVLTDSNGQFSIAGDYTCMPNSQVYLYSVGGNPGAGVNAAASLMAIVGTCPTAANVDAAIPSLWINEVSTIAAAYAMSAYATDATHVSSSNTPLALSGIQNAFANAANLVNTTSGTARTTTLAGNGTVPAATIYTLANILSACIDSTGPGSAPCTTLLSAATSDGTLSGTPATETATAALYIAHHPAANVAQIYSVANGGSISGGGGLTGLPSDFSLSIVYTGGGLSLASAPAIDAQGNVWIAEGNGPNGNGALVEFNSLGAPVSPAGGWTDPSLSLPDAVVLDNSGNAWVANGNGNSLSRFSSTGAFAATVSGPSGDLMNPKSMAVDPAGNLWVASSAPSTGGLMKFSGTGAYMATYDGNGLADPNGLAIDSAGDLWLSQTSGISEFTSAGVPSQGSPFRPGASSFVDVALDCFGRTWTLGGDGSINVLNQAENSFYALPLTGSTVAVSEALDGAGNNWILTSTPGSPVSGLVEVSAAGNVVSTNAGYSINSGVYSAGGPAIDGSGNVWVAAGGQVTEFLGLATPVATPMAANLRSPYSAPASRP